MPLAPALGYIAVRYWLLPNRPVEWRNTIGLPLVVAACTVIVSPIWGLASALVSTTLHVLPVVLNQLALALIAGLLSGICLYGSERLATRLFFGKVEAGSLRRALCGAHAAGIVTVLLTASLPVTASVYLFHAAITQTWGKWLLLPTSIVGWIVYLLLSWRAWGNAPRPASDARSVARGLVLTFVALSLIGAAALAPHIGPLNALMWPLSYFAGWPKT
jgi:hypothetical protein